MQAIKITLYIAGQVIHWSLCGVMVLFTVTAFLMLIYEYFFVILAIAVIGCVTVKVTDYIGEADTNKHRVRMLEEENEQLKKRLSA